MSTLTTGILALSLLMAGGAGGIVTDEPPRAWPDGGALELPQVDLSLPLSGATDPGPTRQEATRPPEEADRIDVNEAGPIELQEVPGIGPVMAQRIISFREDFGPFERVEDLLDVRGIGLRTLENIRPFIRVGNTGDKLTAM